jgi:hypothetical protein
MSKPNTPLDNARAAASLFDSKQRKPSNGCPHPPSRLWAWTALDKTLCVCCCECGAVLRGGATLEGEE